MLGAFMAGLVLGAFCMAMVVVVTINVKASEPRVTHLPTYEPPASTEVRWHATERG